MSLTITELASVAAITATGSVAVKWLYERVRDAQISRKFVADMATNHLPHIYDGLKKLAGRLDVELDPDPPIQFISFREANKHHSERETR